MANEGPSVAGGRRSSSSHFRRRLAHSRFRTLGNVGVAAENFRRMTLDRDDGSSSEDLHISPLCRHQSDGQRPSPLAEENEFEVSSYQDGCLADPGLSRHGSDPSCYKLRDPSSPEPSFQPLRFYEPPSVRAGKSTSASFSPVENGSSRRCPVGGRKSPGENELSPLCGPPQLKCTHVGDGEKSVRDTESSPSEHNDDWNFPIFKLESKQLLSATNSLAYGVGTSGKPPPSVFRRRLSIGHFRASDVSLDQLKQFRQQIADGEVISQGNASPPASPSSPSCRSLNGMLAADKDNSIRTVDKSGNVGGFEQIMPGKRSPVPDVQEPCPVPENTTLRTEMCQPATVGIATKYLPTVLADDLMYNGVGLVACHAAYAESPENGQDAENDGEIILSDLVTPRRFSDVPLLQELDDWNYPIFLLACETGGRVLSMLICQLFDAHGLFTELQIPQEEFRAYFEALECGYRENAYHNRIHAADVLHSIAYLLNSEILGFNVAYSGEGHSSSVAGHCVARDYSRTEIKSALGVDGLRANSCRAMRDALSPLELAACFIAAAQHDYDHPARTNSFLVTTQSDLAILYNDRAVLEQHHAAASWKLLLQNPKYNFLKNMSSEDKKILRSLSLELILATDLAKHFEIISSFKKNLSSGDTFLKAREDRLSIMQMCIKIADISGPTKCGPLHRKWAYLICEEFYDQGREEAALNVPISPYMDESQPLLPKLQISFIANLLRPLLVAYAQAGFMPGPYELVEESEVPENQTEDEHPQSSLGRLHNNVVSVVIRNANENEAFWKDFQKQEAET